MYVTAIDTSWQSGQTTFGQFRLPRLLYQWDMAAYFANVITNYHNQLMQMDLERHM